VPDDLEGLDDALLPAEPYDPAQMHADFRSTFLANEVTERVLRQIMAWGHVGKTATSMPSPIDPHRVMAAEGARALALTINRTIHIQPPAQRPTQQNKGITDAPTQTDD